MQQCNLTAVSLDAFHEFWLADSNDERVPLPGPQPLAPATVPIEISAAQHKAELVSHLMALAEIAHPRADWRLAVKRRLPSWSQPCWLTIAPRNWTKAGWVRVVSLLLTHLCRRRNSSKSARQVWSRGHRAGRRKQQSRIRRSRFRRLINL
jgi:hypothetical protein